MNEVRLIQETNRHNTLIDNARSKNSTGRIRDLYARIALLNSILGSVNGKTIDGAPPVNANLAPDLLRLLRDYRRVIDGTGDRTDIHCIDTIKAVLKDLNKVIKG